MALNNPDDTLDAFFGVFGSGRTDAQKVADLVGLFCPDDNAQHPTIPAIGITHHGPNFVGVARVRKLWTQFFTSFRHFSIDVADLTLPGQAQDIPAPRLYSKANYPTQQAPIPMIGVQTTLRGDFVHKWFQDADASQPLSGIDPVPAGQDGPLPTIIYACTVFAFDRTSHKITHLWAYLDRYKLSHDLRPGQTALLEGFSRAIVERQHALEEIRKRRRR